MRKELLAATAIAMILGAGAALAQSGGDVRSNDRKAEKALDEQKLTPLQPVRHVGPKDWPAAKDDAANKDTVRATQNAAKQAPSNPAPTETTGQVTKPAVQQEAAQPKPDATQAAGNKPNTAPSAQNVQQPQQSTAQSAGQKPEPTKESFANIRLGTDASGRVAINNDQERQISRALQKRDVRPITRTDISVTVGATVPGDIRTSAVSAGIVEVLPQFRGYSYFATGDQIVIVEPGNKKIVALVPVKLTATASTPARQRSVTSTGTETQARTTSRKRNVERDITVGSRLPDDIPLYALPPGTFVRPFRSAPNTVVIERRPRAYIYEDDD